MTKSNPKVWPTTEHGCHQATYSGWECDDVIISAGGYVNGVYVPASEVDSARLWDRLSEDVRAEMPSPDGCDPAEWNDRILELKQKGVSGEDAELLEALWVSGEVCDGEVTIYGTDDGVTRLDEDDLRGLGLDRIDDDDDDDEEDEEPTTIPPTGVTKTNKYDLEVTTWPTERGVHSATYTGWVSDGAGPYDDTIINAGGWIDDKYFDSSDEIGLNRLWDRLPEDVKDELDGCTPVERNGKIIELEQSGELSPEDEKILDAFWCEGEAWDGSVTIYGRDATVSEMSEWELNAWGLKRLDLDDDDATEDEDE